MLGRSALLAATNSENYGNWLGNYSDVSLLLRGATTATLANPPLDESQAPNTITVFGNASVTTAVARWNQGSGGSSLAFDGIGDYFDIANPSAAEFGSLDFTIEFWIYAPSGFAASATVISKGISGSIGSDWWTIEGSSGGNLTFYAAPNATPYFATSAQPWLSNWAHIAICRSGSNSRLFVNGVQSGATYTTLSNFVSGGFIRIGSSTYSASRTMNGYIDDLRITKGIARYETGTGANAGKMVFAGTNTLALPTAQLPANITDDPSYNSVSLLLRNGTPLLVPLDESPTPKTITAVGDAGISTTVFKYGTSSLVFDGSGDYFNFTDSSNTLDIGGTNATLEGWVRVNTGGSGGRTIIGKHGGQGDWNTSNGFLYQLQYDYSAQRFVFVFNNGGGIGGATGISGGSQPPGTDWYHIAVVTNTSNNITLFVNGISVATTTNAISKPVTRTSVRIGNDLASSFFNGYIDDLRHTRVARYTSNFTPPPAELPNF